MSIACARGKPTSDVEITNASKHGFWILVQDRELFAPFKDFPWFKRASVESDNPTVRPLDAGGSA